MNKEVQLEALFREVTRMLVTAGVFPRVPPLPGLPDPETYAGRWAREHPNEAYRLAVDMRDSE